MKSPPPIDARDAGSPASHAILSRTRATKQDGRDNLLRAAGDLLWERSYYSITVDNICLRAKVRKGSFYYFFPSKSALAVAALDYLWDTLGHPAYIRYFSSARPPLQRIVDFLTWVQQLQSEEASLHGQVMGNPFFSLGCELGAQESEIGQKLREILLKQLGYFEQAIREAVAAQSIEPCDPHAAALWLQNAMEGALARARIVGSTDCVQALNRLPEIILRIQNGNLPTSSLPA